MRKLSEIYHTVLEFGIPTKKLLITKEQLEEEPLETLNGLVPLGFHGAEYQAIMYAIAKKKMELHERKRIQQDD